MAATLKFSGSLSQSDPATNGVLIVGQTRHLAQLKYEDVKIKFGGRVEYEVAVFDLLCCLNLLLLQGPE